MNRSDKYSEENKRQFFPCSSCYERSPLQSFLKNDRPIASSSSACERQINPRDAKISYSNLSFSMAVGGKLPSNSVFDKFCELSAIGAPLEEYKNLTMSEPEILSLHWYLQRRMTLVSNTLQRWFISWMLFSILWSLTYIVAWLKNPSVGEVIVSDNSSSKLTGFAVALLFLPLILLWLSLSAYAEVNAEVNHLMRAIYPVEGNRLGFLRLAMPNKGTQAIQVGLFGMPLTHLTVVKVVLALIITISARIVWAEVSYSLKS